MHCAIVPDVFFKIINKIIEIKFKKYCLPVLIQKLIFTAFVKKFYGLFIKCTSSFFHSAPTTCPHNIPISLTLSVGPLKPAWCFKYEFKYN